MIIVLKRTQRKQTGVKQERVGDFVFVDAETHKEIHSNKQEKSKTASVVLRRGRGRQQMEGLKIINGILREITKAESRDGVYAQAGIAIGYANAMQKYGLMSEDELKDVVDAIGQEGESALHRIETTKPLF